MVEGAAGVMDAERIEALERELEQTRRAAVVMISGIVDAIVRSPEGREELAQGFDEAAEGVDPATARLARLVADAIRQRQSGVKA